MSEREELPRRISAALESNNGVLRAAIEQLMAQAWDEGEAVGFDEGRGYNGATPNPYRPAA